jgi:hypothetical protein
MAKVVVSLEDIEEARERRLGWPDRRCEAMMQPTRRPKLGKRPIGSVWNADVLRRSPGSRIPAVDFVKAVYAERTGQE